MTSIATRLGKRIRELRKQQGMTQDQLAELAGMSNKHVGEIERGEVNATLVSLERVSAALDLPLHDLIFGDIHLSVDEKRAYLIGALKDASDDQLEALYRYVRFVLPCGG